LRVEGEREGRTSGDGGAGESPRVSGVVGFEDRIDVCPASVQASGV